VLGALALVWRGDWVNLETTWIKSPAEAANDAALACGIPSFEHEERPLRSSEVRLLYELKHPLQQSQTPLVIGEVQFGVFGDLCEPRAACDNEILRL
jgi:hypothetical protein